MNWNPITSPAHLEQLIEVSHQKQVIIFKHSTRCSVSSMALNRLERSWNASEMEAVTPYFLDLIAHRSLSNQIASTFGVEHESPQVLVIEKGDCIYHASHMGINYQELASFTNADHS